MRKKIFGRKLSRNRATREALFVSLVREVILKGEITTTLAKAKAIVPDLEKLANLAKSADLSAKRQIMASLRNDREAFAALLKTHTGASKQSGFTRIVTLPSRPGDRAEMAKIGWVSVTDDKKKD